MRADSRRVAARLALVLGLLAALAGPAAADVLVSNIAAGGTSGSSLSTFDHAQGFTTGANADGYTLTSVEVQFTDRSNKTPAGVSVKIATGLPAATTEVATLTNPASLVADGANKFTTTGITLAASTTYWVVVEATEGTLETTSSSDDDAGGADGWSVADNGLFRTRTSTGAWSSGFIKKIRVNGSVGAVTNAAPSFPSSAPAALSVAENSPAGAEVGTVAAADEDGDTLTYVLGSSGTDHDSFAIDAGGLITVAAGATLDHEAKASYSVTVSVHDGKASDGSADTTVDATHDVTIGVTDVPEPPAAPAAVTVTRASQNSLSVSWTAPDTTGIPPVTDYDVRHFRGSADPAIEARWVEPGESGGHDHVGAATSTTITGLARNAPYVVQVRAANDEGTSAWSASGLGSTETQAAVTDVAMASKPRLDANDDMTNDTYGLGQAIVVEVTWDREVTWDLSAAGAGMAVRLDVGGTIRMAELATGGADSGTASTLRFRYTVAQDDADTDGVAVTAAADGSLVVLRGGATLQDALGRAAQRNHAGLTAQANHKVDGSTDAPANHAPQCTAAQRPGDPPSNAPADTFISLTVAYCSDADGDKLAVTVSVDKPEVFIEVVYRPDFNRAFVQAHETCVLAGITPALPNPIITTVTQTVTDPDGQTAQASARLSTSIGNCPTLRSATVNGATLTLTYSEALRQSSVPAPADFAVKVDGQAVDLRSTRAVSITGSSVILTLAAAVADDAEVTLTWVRDDDASIRAAGTPSFPGPRALGFKDHPVVNLGRAQVASVKLVSTPTADVNGDDVVETYKGGDVVRARVTFTTAVDVVGSPVLQARFESSEKAMTFDTARSRTNTTTLEFTYTVADGNLATQGIAFSANTLSAGEGVSIRNTGTTVDANLDFAAVDHNARHKVDGARPALDRHLIRGIKITTPPGDIFAIGNTIVVTAYFTEKVVVTTAGDPVAGPRVNLRIGGVTRYAVYATGSDTKELVFRYTVVEGDQDRNGQLIPRNPLALNGGTIADLAGNEAGPAQLGHNPRGSIQWKVDGVRPQVSGATVDRATLVLTWNEALDKNSVPARGDFEVKVAGSARNVARNGVAVDGSTVTLTLASAVGVGEEVTVSYTADKPAIRDAAGNAAADVPARTVTNITAPAVTSVEMASTAGPDDTYAPGDTVAVRVTFDAAVTVDTTDGTPRLKLDLGDDPSSGERWAAYIGGDGPTELDFAYTVVAGDLSTQGIAVLTDTLEANGGTLRSAGDLDAVLAHPAVAASASHKVDGVAPTLRSAAVDGAALTLSYAEALDESSEPAASAFTVKADTNEVSLAASNPVAVAGSAVTLTLAAAVRVGAVVTVTYTVPNADPIRDPFGNAAAGMTDEPVRNVTQDTMSPVLRSAAVNGDTLTLTYDEALDLESEPAASVFAVKVDTNTVSLAATDPVEVRGRAVVLTLASAVSAGQSVTVSYRPPTADPIQDIAGNAAAGLTDESVINVTGDATAPVLRSATVAGSALTLSYDETLDPGSVPAKEAFTVKVDTNEVSLAATDPVAVAGSAVTLTLAAAVTAGAVVTVTYAVPDDDPIQDLAGNDAAGLTDRAVDNTTPRPVLTRATVGDDTLALFYDRTLDTASEPAPADFTVTVAGSGRGVTGVEVRAGYVILTLASAVTAGEAVRVTYTAATNPIRDVASNTAENLSDREVAHNRAPTYTGATNIRHPNAQPLALVWREVPETQFRDADGDPLTFMVSTDRDDVLYLDGDGFNYRAGFVFFQAEDDCVLQHLTPPLPGSPYDAVVTVTATDPHGATAQVMVTFRVPYTCPVLQSATVKGATLRLTYSQTLDTASEPAPDDFVVKVDATPVSLATTDPVDVSSRAVTLTLASAVSAGQRVTVTYTPGDSPIRDFDGGDAAGRLTDEPVRNVTGDATAPVLQSAAVDSPLLTLIYDEALDAESVPAASAFTVKVDGTTVPLVTATPSVSPVWIGGTAVTLILQGGTAAVGAGQEVTVTYTKPTGATAQPIQDLAGNDAGP